MSDPATWAYLAAAAAGTYMQTEAQNDADERQQRALNASLEQQDQFSRKAEQTAMQNAEQYAPEKRLERFEAAREAAGDSLAQQLTQARETVAKPDQASGRLSQAFDTASAKAHADQLQDSVDMARAMGKVRGVQDMLMGEGFMNADYASQLGQIGRNAQGSARAAGIGIEAAGVPDSTQMAVGGFLQGAGSSGAFSKMFAKSATPQKSTTGG